MSIVTAPVTVLTQYAGPVTAVSESINQKVGLQGDTAGSLYVSGENRKASYSALQSFNVPATFNSLTSLPGSSSKIIRLTRVEVSASTITANAFASVILIKRSPINTGGAPSAIAVTPHDSLFPASSVTPLQFTSNTGTVGAGNVFRQAIVVIPFLGTAATTTPATTPTPLVVWNFGSGGTAGSITLHGTNQSVDVSLAANPANTTSISVMYEWTEENA